MELCFLTTQSQKEDEYWRNGDKQKRPKEQGEGYRGNRQPREREQYHRRWRRQEQMEQPSPRTRDGRPRCEICKRIGHSTGSCKVDIICYGCGIRGHIKAECRRNRQLGQQWNQQQRQTSRKYVNPNQQQRQSRNKYKFSQRQENFNA